MTKDMISVIVPVYKVEAYLDKCVQSIVDQTYKNLEIILVDDGSPDRCGELCDAWAAKDGRIRVVHKKNGGLSDARNAGMAIATGEYMGFIDSDDYIAPDMYRLLLERLTADDSDIAACGVEMIFEDGMPPRMLTPAGCHVLDNGRAIEAVVREGLLLEPVWYKLYKTDLIRDISFAVGKCHEDVFWSWQAVARAKKVSIFDAPCYYYLQRSGSIMGEKFSEKRLDAIEAKCLRLEYLTSHYPELVPAALCGLHFECLYFGQQAIRTLLGKEASSILKRLTNTLAEHPIGADILSSQKLSRRVWLRLANVSFLTACRIRNLLRIGC